MYCICSEGEEEGRGVKSKGKREGRVLEDIVTESTDFLDVG